MFLSECLRCETPGAQPGACLVWRSPAVPRPGWAVGAVDRQPLRLVQLEVADPSETQRVNNAESQQRTTCWAPKPAGYPPCRWLQAVFEMQCSRCSVQDAAVQVGGAPPVPQSARQAARTPSRCTRSHAAPWSRRRPPECQAPRPRCAHRCQSAACRHSAQTGRSGAAVSRRGTAARPHSALTRRQAVAAWARGTAARRHSVLTGR